MRYIAMLLVAVSVLFIGVALLIKMNTVGAMMPGPMPTNWLRLTDTTLMFSIAISLLCLTKNKQ